MIALSVFMSVSAHVNPSERVRARECVHACVTMPDSVYVYHVVLWGNLCGCVRVCLCVFEYVPLFICRYKWMY